MIGNDIVDLAQAKRESNWRRTGFLAKIFTSYEQHLIDAAINPDQMVWLLWSMKESAYKLAIRSTQKRVFAPQKLACHIDELTGTTCSGTVHYVEEYRSISVLAPDYISTITCSADIAPTLTETIIPFADATYQTQHRVIRQRIIQHCSALFAVPEQAIQLCKNNIGIPEVRVANSAVLPLSISHHGHFGAYVMVDSTMEIHNTPG